VHAIGCNRAKSPRWKCRGTPSRQVPPQCVGPEVTIIFEDGKLFASAQGMKFEVCPESENLFFSPEQALRFRFKRFSEGIIEMTADSGTAPRQ
jgi:hypothetical protein